MTSESKSLNAGASQEPKRSFLYNSAITLELQYVSCKLLLFLASFVSFKILYVITAIVTTSRMKLSSLRFALSQPTPVICNLFGFSLKSQSVLILK